MVLLSSQVEDPLMRSIGRLREADQDRYASVKASLRNSCPCLFVSLFWGGMYVFVCLFVCLPDRHTLARFRLNEGSINQGRSDLLR